MPSGGGNIFSSNQKSKSTTAPWKPLQPYLLEGFSQAKENVLDRPLEFYPESTAVPFSPETETALAAQTGRAFAGNPLNPASQDQLLRTMSGDFLSGGQGYQDYLDSVISDVRPGVDAMFSSAGRAGSPLHAESLGRGVGRGMAPLYDAERGRMMQAAGMSPELANQDYFDIQQLAQAGKGREDLFARELQDQIDRFNFGESEPYNRIAQFMGLLEGGLGFSENKAKTIYNPNPLLTMNALASDAASTGSSVAGSFMCSMAAKEANTPADPVLPKLDQLTVENWNYKPKVGLMTDTHIGPYAEEFKELFGVGDGVTISAVDALGVCLKAIQELSAEMKALKEGKEHAQR